jgi:hypothetical protein
MKELLTPYLPKRYLLKGAMYTEARPNPLTTMPVIKPFFAGGNHLTAAGVAEAYPSPIPVPAMTPKPKMTGNMFPDVAKPATIIPNPVRIAPMVAMIRGPNLS